ncbi:hypothetical protein [Acidovorax sp. LjRoot117]|uniref:hypothetical protein n=1 Tax=Acidovorax sp. LjRoot117 TaxID=3342255 RepID=UPI003ECE4CDC
MFEAIITIMYALNGRPQVEELKSDTPIAAASVAECKEKMLARMLPGLQEMKATPGVTRLSYSIRCTPKG